MARPPATKGPIKQPPTDRAQRARRRKSPSAPQAPGEEGDPDAVRGGGGRKSPRIKNRKSPRIIVTAAVVRRGDQILITKRMRGAHLEGYWEFPGGKLEEGESPEEALRRECREECGIEIEVGDILDVAFHRYPGKDVLLLFYDCVLLSGEVIHRGVAAHEWITPAELDRFTLPPPDMRLVAKLKERAQRR